MIDELALDTAPVLLSSGERILDGVESFGFEPAEVLHSPPTSHIGLPPRQLTPQAESVAFTVEPPPSHHCRLSTLASAACGLGVLVAVRAVQGIGAAVLVPCSLTLLNHAYPDRAARSRAVGLWAPQVPAPRCPQDRWSAAC